MGPDAKAGPSTVPELPAVVAKTDSVLVAAAEPLDHSTPQVPTAKLEVTAATHESLNQPLDTA